MILFSSILIALFCFTNISNASNLITIPDSNKSLTALLNATKVKLDLTTYESHKWTGIQGTTEDYLNSEKNDHRLMFKVPADYKKDSNEVEYNNCLDIYFKNVAEIANRKVNAKLHINKVTLGSPASNMQQGYEGYFLAIQSQGSLSVGNSLSRDGIMGNRNYDIDLTLELTYADDNSIVTLPFYQVIDDVDIYRSALGANSESWEGLKGYVKDIYHFEELVSTISGMKIIANDNCSDFKGNDSYLKSGCIVPTTNGSLKMHWAGRGCASKLSIYSEYIDIEKPTKTVNSTRDYYLDDNVKWTINSPRGKFYEETFSKYNKYEIYDILDERLEYINAKLYDGNKEVTGTYGTITYDSNTRKVTYKIKESLLNNTDFYNGKDLKLEIETKIKTVNGAKIKNKGFANISNSVWETNEVKINTKFKITTEVENGVIDNSLDNISLNETKTINYHENNGYMIKSIIIDGEKINLKNNLNNYTFTNINANHHIKVVYEKIPTQDFHVIGIWNDDDNRDGYRPEILQISYLVNNKEQEIINLSEINEWKTDKVNLPLYTKQGEKIEYNFKALGYEYIDKYEVSDEKEGNTFKFINKHEPERVESKVTKIWNDENNHDGFRPNEIQVQLYKNDEIIKTITLNNSNNWQYIEKDLYKYNPIGITNLYYWKEIKNYENENKYEISIRQEENNTVITNIHTPEKIDSRITKIWDDGENQDGFRPEEIQMQLYKNDEIIKTVILNTDNNWTHTETNLEKYSPIGQLNKYYWKEIENYPNHDEYETLEPVQNDYNTTITNYHELERVSSTITKVWDDENDNDGFRPSTIYAKLYQNGKVIKDRVILNKSNQYTYTESNLPKYYDGGKEYQYSWDEYITYENADKYTYTKEQEGNNTIIINAHELETVNVQVQKIWEDNNNHDRLRPSEIEVNLLANNKPIQTIKLNNLNSWKATISNLPKYEKGKEISYTFEEPKPYGDYASQVKTKKNITVITNSRTDYTTSVSITKIWADNNDQDGKRPQEIQVQLEADDEFIKEIILNAENNWECKVDGLPLNNDKGEKIKYSIKESKEYEGYTSKIESNENSFKIINTHKPETISFHIRKEWDDNNNQDGIRPDEVIVKLLANNKPLEQLIRLNESNNWEMSTEDLPKYENGIEVKYKFIENDIANYESKQEIQNNEIIIINKHTPETKELIIQKEWNDANNRYGIRPDEIECDLLANGKKIKRVTLTKDKNWIETISGLAVNENGKEIVYSVQELNIVGYRTQYSEINNTFIIVNQLDLTVHGPEEMVIEVQKIWDDDNNRDRFRPEEIRVNLLVNDKYYKGYTLNEANNWQVQISNLTGANGKVKYRWEEEIPNNYTNEITEDAESTIITNSYTPEITTATVIKEWEDNNNQDGIRPKEVTVVLLANGEPTDKTLTLSNENDWKGTISNLPKNKDGEQINYTFKLKDSIEQYTTSYNFEFDSNTTTIIKSVYKPEEVEAIVESEWIDDNDRDGLRPKEIEVILMNKDHVVLDKEGNPVILNLSEDNSWSAKVETLPKYTDGIENNYSFKLKNVIEQYTSTYEYSLNKTKIINEHVSEQVTPEVQKIWKDDNNRDKVRPDEVVVILMRDSKPTNMKFTLNESNNWYEKVENQPKYENGKEITYNFVLESEIDKYKTDYSQDGYKTIITSQYESEQIQPEVQIIWDDLDNKFLKRPDKVVVKLYINEEPSDIEVTLKKEDNWYKQLEAMPKYKDGKEIEYKFIEEVPEKYKENYSYKTIKTTITNYLREEDVIIPPTESETTEKETVKEQVEIKDKSVPKDQVFLEESNIEEKVDKGVKTNDSSTIKIFLILFLISLSTLKLYKKCNKK